MPVHRREDGALHLDDKFISGMSEYAARFPGEVVALTSQGPAPATPVPNMRYVSPDEIPFHVQTSGLDPDALSALSADVALLPLLPWFAPHLGGARRTVYVAEHSAQSRYAMEAVASTGRIARARLRLGFLRWGRAMHRLAARGDGLQCNGWTAWNAFSGAHRRAMRYYDNRVTSEVLTQSASREEAASSTLRLAFSGRLLAIKGPADAVRVAERVRGEGHDVSLTIFGVGPEEQALRALAGPATTFAGSLDFRTEWVDMVPDLIDVMVLPHPQGDPSGTYLESMGVGVPVLGYANSHWRHLAEESGGGWAAPVGDVDSLASAIRALVDDRSSVARARAQGLAFMRTHTMEADFDARVDHLVWSCTPESLAVDDGQWAWIQIMLEPFARRARSFLTTPVLDRLDRPAPGGPDRVTQLLLRAEHQRTLRAGEPLPGFAGAGFKAFSQADEDGILWYVFSLIGETTRPVSLDLDGVDYWIWDALTAIQPRVVILEYQDILGPDDSLTVPYADAFNAYDHPTTDGLPNFAGASLRAFTELGARKGYRLVGTNRYG
jgi:Glycosyltransferase